MLDLETLLAYLTLIQRWEHLMVKAFWSVLGWTIVWSIFSTGTVFFGGFIQALILNSEKVVFRKLWRTILILPWAIPAIISNGIFGDV